MLLEYGFRNFFSFREGAVVSLRLDGSCPEVFSKGRSVATVLGVKGANGAGKTHLLKGLAFLAHFCIHSFDNEPEGLIGFSSFFENRDPSSLYAEFRSNSGVEYRYEVELTDEAVLVETIYRIKKRKTLLLKRVGVAKVEGPKEVDALRKIKLRPNVSIVSLAHQYGLTILDDVHKFFKYMVTNVNYVGYRDIFRNQGAVAKFLFEKPQILEFVSKFIRECDVGISNIEIVEKKEAQDSLKESKPTYDAVCYHMVDNKEKQLPMALESNGTKTLFRSMALYEIVLRSGGVAIIDEFDVHLHPHLLSKIIDLFENPETNPHNAQLIFSAHDDSVMDLLGRYRTILVNKESNESFSYRLDEVPGTVLRNDRSMVPTYNDGKIGGVPRV